MRVLFEVEWLKFKRTRIWLFATLLPLLAVLQGQFFFQLLKDRAGGIDPWALLYSGSLSLFAPLVLPFLIALLTSLVARVEHQQETWKQLFALPVRRDLVYAVKLFLSLGLVAYSLLVLMVGMLLVGWFNGLGSPIPWELLLGRPALMGLAALPILAVQYFLSYRFRQGFVPLAAAAALTLPALLTANAEHFWLYYPWSYPTVLAMTEGIIPTGKLLTALLVSLLLFAGICGYSLRKFARQDVV